MTDTTKPEYAYSTDADADEAHGYWTRGYQSRDGALKDSGSVSGAKVKTALVLPNATPDGFAVEGEWASDWAEDCFSDNPNGLFGDWDSPFIQATQEQYNALTSVLTDAFNNWISTVGTKAFRVTDVQEHEVER